EAESQVERVLAAELQTVDLARAAVDGRGDIGGRRAGAVGNRSRHVGSRHEIVHGLVEIPDADQAASRKVVFPGQIELRSAERVEARIARVAAVEFEADRGTALAVARG